MTTDSLKGKELIVNFWSASDAESRLANRRLSDLADKGDNSDRLYLSVCIDKSSVLSEEIAKADGLSERVISLRAEDVAPEVLDDYQTRRGCRTFRIDRFGQLQSATPCSQFQ